MFHADFVGAHFSAPPWTRLTPMAVQRSPLGDLEIRDQTQP
jgi:hypothetical protein